MTSTKSSLLQWIASGMAIWLLQAVALAQTTYYEVWRSTSPYSSTAQRIAASVTSTHYDDTSITLGQTYYYWIKVKTLVTVSSTIFVPTSLLYITNSITCPTSAKRGGLSEIRTETDFWGSNAGISPTVTWDLREQDLLGLSDSMLSWTQTVYLQNLTLDREIKTHPVNLGNFESSSTIPVFSRMTASTGLGIQLDTPVVNCVLQSSWDAAPTGVSASDGTYSDHVHISWSTASGNSDFSAPVSGYASCPAPAAPTGVSATLGGYCSFVRVTWNSSSGAAGYMLYRDGIFISTTDQTSYDDYPGDSSQHLYTLKAYSNCNATSGWSSSATGYASSAPVAPTSISASKGTYCGYVHITWDSISAASSYVVYRDGADITSTGATSYNDYPGDTSAHSYKVTAANSCGVSGFSATDSGYVESVTITLSSSPSNGGSTSGGGAFPCGSSVTVTATANSGYTFQHWTEDGNVVGLSASYNFVANGSLSLVATFTSNQDTGSLQVNISPTDAVSAGAQWQVDGGPWQSSGSTVSDLSAGTHPVSFRVISGWTTPTNQTVTISANQTTTITAAYALATVCAPDLTNGLVGYWKLDGNTDDSSPYTNDGVVNGDLHYDPNAPLGMAGRFIPTPGTYVTINHQPQYVFTNAFSVQFWYKPTKVPNDGRILQKHYPTQQYYSNSNTWEVLHRTDNRIYFLYAWPPDAASDFQYICPLPCVISNWQDVVYTYSASDNTFRGYVNGVLVTNQTPSHSPLPLNTALSLLLMHDRQGNNDAEGWLDGVRLYNRALSAAEVQQLFLLGWPQLQRPILNLDTSLLGSGGLKLALHGQANLNYSIECSTDLISWTSITNYVLASSETNFIDLSLTSSRQRFYRAVLLTTNMTLIPAGPFTMGNCMDTNEGDADELPLHTVYVSAFYMDRFDVTYSFWVRVYNWATNHGYTFDDPGSGKSSSHPVENVNWYDCVKWCNARSEMEGRTPAYYANASRTVVYRTGDLDLSNSWVNWARGYRLPTEAEWEKAARGGLGGHRFPWGDTISESQANYYGQTNTYSYDLGPDGYNSLGDIGNEPYTTPVDSFAPNWYGLYDMAGNVWQYCWDWYSDSWYGNTGATQSNTQGPTSSSNGRRVVRGGDWDNGALAHSARCANRDFDSPANAWDYYGFRSVLPAGQ